MASGAGGRATAVRLIVGSLFGLAVATAFGVPAQVRAVDPAAPSVRPEVLGGRPVGADGDLTVDSVPAGFQDTVVFDGLSSPTAVSFAPDGRVFVAEKSGKVKVYSSLDDTTPTDFADLRTKVYDFWDRGLLGLAVSPTFPTDPSVYVLYTYDHILGDDAGNVPRWQTGGPSSCPTPPGPTTDGCVVSARLSRLTMGAGGTSSDETVLIEDWCQQFPSHSIGTITFGGDGSLYVGGGDGASFTNVPDYGQLGGSTGSPTPVNPCGDPANEGGSLRSQDLRTTGDSAVTLDGAILRIDPDTGQGWPTNPNAGSGNANTRRIIAEGLRNPFRFTIRPGTNELWVGDVGNDLFEEIDRIVPSASVVRNAGWPCYEGVDRFEKFDDANLAICEDLYGDGASAVVAPSFQYDHRREVVSGDGCGGSPTTTDPISSVISGISFYSGSGSYPAQYDGGLFFLDNARECLWWMPAGAGGLPDTSDVRLFASGVVSPVQLVTGPGGDLYYVAFDPSSATANDGAIRRIKYVSGDNPPVASFTFSPSAPAVGQTINLDARGSSDADSDPLTFAWDFDNDGAYDDATGSQPTVSYGTPGDQTVRLRVSDGVPGGTATTSRVISVGNTAPNPVVDSPASGGSYAVGQSVSFSGHATDAEDGAMPATALTWTVAIEHCPSDCHEHVVQTIDGVASGSFAMPDHTYPSYVQLRLTATDQFGKSKTVSRNIEYGTAVVALRSTPTGASVSLDGDPSTAPANVTVLKGSSHTLSAPATQTIGGVTRSFVSWSDGGARSHTIVVSTNKTYTATYSGSSDVTPPKVGLIRAGMATGSVAGPSTPGRVRWSASDSGSGIARYEAQMSRDGGAHWTGLTLSPVTRTDVAVALWQSTSYRFRVRATDGAGNTSSWAYTGVFTVSVGQESTTSATYSGTWSSVSDASAWGGKARRANAFGESVTYRFTGRAVAWVAPRGAGYGIVRVYVDGVLKATLDLGSASAASRVVQFATDFSGSAAHTLRIANLGTSGRPLADVDAFIVYR